MLLKSSQNQVNLPVTSLGGGLFQKTLLALDCAATARLLPKTDRRDLLKRVLKPNLRHSARVASLVQLAGSLGSGFPNWISKRLFHGQPLRGRLELLAQGTGSTVFRTAHGSRSRVVKILRRSLGCSLENQLRIALEFKRKHSILASRLNSDYPIVPPTDFVILQGPLLARPATALVQPLLDCPARDLMQDFSESELSLLVARQPSLRMQISELARNVIKDFEEGRCCLDIVGQGNVLVLTRPDGELSLKVVDLGMFDLTRIPLEAPERFARLVRCIEKLQSWLSLCDQACNQPTQMTPGIRAEVRPAGNRRPTVRGLN